MATILCEICIDKPADFPNHYEEHVNPPRELDICKGCHTSIHLLGKKKPRRLSVSGTYPWIPVRVQIDGRIQIPRPLRDCYHINPGGLTEIKIRKGEKGDE